MKSQRLIALLCVIALIFTSCGKEKNTPIASDNGAVQNAKESKDYKETKVELPQDMTGMLGTFQAPDGAPAIFGVDYSNDENQDVTEISFKYWKYNLNAEEEWEKNDVEWGDSLNNLVNSFPVGGLVTGEDGNDYMVMAKYTGRTSDKNIDEKEIDLELYRMSGKEAEEVECEGLHKKEGDGKFRIRNISVGQDGFAVFQYVDGKCALYDLETGKEKMEYSQKFTSVVGVYQDCLFGSNEAKDAIVVVDRNSGELLSTIPADIGNSEIMFCMNSELDIFYIVEQGIYRIADDMKSSEKIVNGDIFTEFGMSSDVSFSGLWERDGIFYAAFRRNSTGEYTGPDSTKLYSYK